MIKNTIVLQASDEVDLVEDKINITTDIEGYENITYEEKRKKALQEANEYLSDCSTIEEAREKIRNNSECFTDKHGYVDGGNLYLCWGVITADPTTNNITWSVRED